MRNRGIQLKTSLLLLKLCWFHSQPWSCFLWLSFSFLIWQQHLKVIGLSPLIWDNFQDQANLHFRIPCLQHYCCFILWMNSYRLLLFLNLSLSFINFSHFFILQSSHSLIFFLLPLLLSTLSLSFPVSLPYFPLLLIDPFSRFLTISLIKENPLQQVWGLSRAEFSIIYSIILCWRLLSNIHSSRLSY